MQLVLKKIIFIEYKAVMNIVSIYSLNDIYLNITYRYHDL